jgi:hypothetical protein
MCALVEEDGPSPSTEYRYNHTIADVVHVTDDTANKRCVARRKRRWIKNGIATVGGCARGG